MDQHFKEDTIFTLPTTPHQTLISTESLDEPPSHQLVTVLEPPLTMSFMAGSYNFQPEGIKEFGVLALHTQ